MIEQIAVRFGGLLVPELPDHVEAVARGHLPDPSPALAGVLTLGHRLRTGQIGVAAFGRKLQECPPGVSDPSPLSRGLIEGLHMDEEVGELLLELSMRHPLVLLVDYPADWFREAWRRGLPGGLMRSVKKLVFLSRVGPAAQKSDLLKIRRPGYLILEPDFRTALGHIRWGMQTIHFVNIDRTRRELALRQLLPADDRRTGGESS